MLDNEENIVENNHYTKNKLDDVDFDIKTENGLKAHLSKREEPTSQVHNNIENRPSSSWFPLIIPVQLRQILKSGDSQLKISQKADFSHGWININRFSALNNNIKSYQNKRRINSRKCPH